MTPIISIQDVTISYRRRKSFFRHEFYQALKGISFDVYPGETLGIIGHNGAGKSTLLKLLAGIYEPDSGVIEVKAKNVSLLALQVGFDVNLSGRDNIIISGLLLGYDKKTVYSLLEDIKAYSEVGDFFEQPIKTYSSGMRARLGFASAYHYRPEVLLIDEVLGVGDAAFRKKAHRDIRSMADSNQTIIVVSHSMPTIESLCDRRLELKVGEIVAG